EQRRGDRGVHAVGERVVRLFSFARSAWQAWIRRAGSVLVIVLQVPGHVISGLPGDLEIQPGCRIDVARAGGSLPIQALLVVVIGDRQQTTTAQGAVDGI